MKLYHFCAAHLLPVIKKEGLILGRIPMLNGSYASTVPGYQWLTINESFDQEWEKYSSLPYRRNAYRITVKIPGTDTNLVKWLDLCAVEKFNKYVKELNSYGDPDNWFVYMGRIKPGRFREIMPNPKTLNVKS